MNYEEVISKIEELPRWHERNELIYIKRVLKELGNPQDKIKTIHVTGTNGKGSTSYYLRNLLEKAGQKTGLFVSPYIEKFNERIQVGGEPIGNADLVEGYLAIQQIIKKIQNEEPDFHLVTFEFEVAMAFWIFYKQQVDYAVIEVGIGGEHDKTNVIVPELSIITTIGLDHEQIIGPTIQDIAKEKSGIIKQKKPVIVGKIPYQVKAIIKEKAQKFSAPIYHLGEDFEIKVNENVLYQTGQEHYQFNWRPEVEAFDIGMAVKAVELLGLQLDKNDVEKAINQTQIPGRYQIVQEKPLIVVDGAHNVQAMKNLLKFIHNQKGQKIHFLVGMMKDKDLTQVFELFDDKDEINLTRISYPRAAKLEDFPIDIQKRATYTEDYKEAFDKVVNRLKKDDILVVTGSFYLVGAILNYIHQGRNQK
ncbi:bifunctional folylpolyglutamate synthase/dihydrofolate synthase [Lactobacillus sp. PV037]|uniref:bifunctional folylpolyglutamate synthase/dihydrofolate synthase n=1 Tax=unclassified Lactobacillus TaxID=2620435 RepID=UPI00224064CA|nr:MULTISPECIES: folylpolyglutamate synthase/dihydrofolate synthase family protein [unclassified Lactobacillus]QNQ82473.1 bifunctional folylpolyglutamate synthase/dihydrofolate synthase [Lactobacillus sp. PV012]QNQ83413.1 bifunctional folylpolyglutamate synthase/dihydrofolate synthase [Lactobacillus sp. PV037]